MDSFKEDYYNILNLNFNASADEVKRAYKQLAKIYHPDCGGEEHLFLRIKDAYEVLSNPIKRTEYDKWYLQKHQNYNSRYYNQTNDNSEPKDTKREFFVSIFDTNTRKILRTKQYVDTKKYPESQYAFYNEYYAVKMYFDNEEKIIFYPKEIWLKKIDENYDTEDAIFLKKVIKISLVAIIIIIVGMYLVHDIWMSGRNLENSTQNSDYNSNVVSEEVSEDPLKGYSEKPVPEHGTTTITYQKNAKKSIFEVKLPKENEEYYFVKLVDSETDETVFSVFMHPGTTLETNVPCGVFKLKYASGLKWYGQDDLFGPYGNYCKSDDIFEFTPGSGYTVTLYNVLDGNMETEDVSYYDF